MENSDNSLVGVGKCDTINYEAQEINASSLQATTNYLESASTVVTLSQSEDCEIYTYANIYIHTDESTTAPVSDVQALQYKIITEDNMEYNGVITEKGDFLLTTVPLTATPTNYTIYLWIDPTISMGQYNNTTYSGYIYATSAQTSTIGSETTEEISPTLFLSKETYIEGFEGWKFANATLDSDGVLTLAETGTTAYSESPYYYVGGETWYYTFDAYTTNETSRYSPNGGIYSGIYYYDDDYNATTALNNKNNEGAAFSSPLNQWVPKDIRTHSNYSYTQNINIKNVKIFFQIVDDDDAQYSQPIVKIKNFKLWGQLSNSFYLINIYSTDNIGVTELKYAFGKQDKSYFASGGTTITEEQITVTENGIYTFYAVDAAGNETINTIEISKIIK